MGQTAKSDWRPLGMLALLIPLLKLSAHDRFTLRLGQLVYRRHNRFAQLAAVGFGFYPSIDLLLRHPVILEKQQQIDIGVRK